MGRKRRDLGFTRTATALNKGTQERGARIFLQYSYKTIKSPISRMTTLWRYVGSPKIGLKWLNTKKNIVLVILKLEVFGKCRR